MKITINQSLSIVENEVIINCSTIDRRMKQLIEYLQQYTFTMQGVAEGEIFHVPIERVLYIESVDGRTFFYDEAKTYGCKESLTYLEDILKHTPFARISKSCILNTGYLKSVKPYVNHRMEATLTNGEKLLIARNYIEDVKEKLNN